MHLCEQKENQNFIRALGAIFTAILIGIVAVPLCTVAVLDCEESKQDACEPSLRGRFSER